MTVADGAGADDLDARAQAVLRRCPGCPSAWRRFCLGGDVAHQPGFPDDVRQRLLAVDVLAQLHRHDRGRRRGVWSGVLTVTASMSRRLLEHLAEVVDTSRPWG